MDLDLCKYCYYLFVPFEKVGSFCYLVLLLKPSSLKTKKASIEASLEKLVEPMRLGLESELSLSQGPSCSETLPCALAALLLCLLQLLQVVALPVTESGGGGGHSSRPTEALQAFGACWGGIVGVLGAADTPWVASPPS